MNIDFDEHLRSSWVAGALGSIVALKFAPGLTWFGRAFNVASGSLCAGFLAPPLAEWLHLSSQGMQSGAAFAVGMFGLSLAAAGAEGIRAVGWGEVIKGWVSRKG